MRGPRRILDCCCGGYPQATLGPPHNHYSADRVVCGGWGKVGGMWYATEELTCSVGHFAQIGVLEAMPEGKKGGRRITKQGQQDCDRIAKEIFESKQ